MLCQRPGGVSEPSSHEALWIRLPVASPCRCSAWRRWNLRRRCGGLSRSKPLCLLRARGRHGRWPDPAAPPPWPPNANSWESCWAPRHWIGWLLRGEGRRASGLTGGWRPSACCNRMLSAPMLLMRQVSESPLGGARGVLACAGASGRISHTGHRAGQSRCARHLV